MPRIKEYSEADAYYPQGQERVLERAPDRLTEEAFDVAPDEVRDTDFDSRDESNLIAPVPRAGKRQRWARVIDADGRPDMKNWIRYLRDGWSPRPPSSIRFNGMNIPAREFEGHDVYMSAGSSVLMEIDEAKFAVLKNMVDDKRRLLDQSVRRDHDVVSAEGTRDGMSSIVREEELTTSKSVPRTMAN